MIHRFLFFLICLMISASSVHARMVSYAGGKTFMTFNDRSSYSTFVHYSPSSIFSIGYLNEYDREKDFWLQAAQVTGLKRWNWEDSQANLYLFGGMGGAFEGDGRGRASLPAALGGASIDWEDRRFYTSMAARGEYAKGFTSGSTQKARLGVAPYVAEYGAIHTWLMVQFDRRPRSDEQYSVTPLIRFFKGSSLLEVGSDLEGNVMFNFVQVF